MAIQNARLLIRRGNEVDFEANNMQPGEWALSTDEKIVRICVAPGVCIRMATYDAFEADMDKIEDILAECRDIQTVVNRINDEVSANANAVAEYTEQAKQYRDEAEQFRNEAEAIVGVDVSQINSDIALNRQTLGYTKKNLLKNTATTKTAQGVEWTVDNNGIVNANGTASARTSFILGKFKAKASKEYILSGVSTNTNGAKIIFNAKTLNYPSDSGSGKTIYSQTEIEASVYIEIPSGATVSNLKFYPMIRLASITDPTYEPYVDDVDTRLKSLESGSGGNGGTAGTTDYEDLSNKPSVNGVELSGNKTTSDLGITAESVGADAEGSASTALSNAKEYTDAKIADLVGGAPSTLDTLKEISDALAESEEVVEAINQAIGNKLDKTGDSKDNTVTFTQASTRANIASTEKHSTLFGKIAKWFADLKTVAFSGSYNDLNDKPTIPTKTSELENDSGFMGSATALDTYEEIMANTESGKFAGAKGVKEGFSAINDSLVASDGLNFKFATDGEGNYGYLGADDSFVPFKSSGDLEIGSITAEGYTGVTLSYVSKTGKNLVVATGSRYGQKKNVYLNCACDNENSIVTTIGSASRMNIDSSYSSAISVFMVECVAGDTITATATGDVNVNGGIVIFDL